MDKDLYEILQVSPNAETAVIDAAYRRLSQKYHPDLNASPDATERMKELNVAFGTLGDVDKRARYDAQRSKSRTARPGTGRPDTNRPPTTNDSTGPKTDSPKSGGASTKTGSASSTPTHCEACGRLALTKHVTFRQNLGLLILRFYKRVEGNLCRDCIDHYFWEFTLKTGVMGWWGVISLIFMPAILIGNIYNYVGALGLSPSYFGTYDKSWGLKWSGTFLILVACIILTITFAIISTVLAGGGPVAPAFSNNGSQNQVRVNVTQTPTIQATSTLRPAATAMPQQDNYPDWAGDFVEITPRDMDVCVTTLDIHEGPSTDSQVVQSTGAGWYWRVYGYVGAWWYLGKDPQGRYMFVPVISMCEHEVTEIPLTFTKTSAPTRARPTATAAAKAMAPTGALHIATETPFYGWQLPESPYPTPSEVCKSYTPPFGSVDLGPYARPYVRGITRPNGIKVYYIVGTREYQDDNEKGGSVYYWCPAEAEANGYVNGKP